MEIAHQRLMKSYNCGILKQKQIQNLVKKSNFLHSGHRFALNLQQFEDNESRKLPHKILLAEVL